MTQIALDKAQQELPELVRRALAGEEIVIAGDNGPAVRLMPCEPAKIFDAESARLRGYGAFAGCFEVSDAFFEPLPEDEMKLWEGRD